jgi:transcriptional regulator with XRE-family HTH domain
MVRVRKPSALAPQIGARLRSIREQNGWSQRELANRVGIGRGQLSRYEAGSELPNLDTLVLICATVYMGVGEFLRGATGADGSAIVDVGLREVLHVVEQLEATYRESAIDMLQAVVARARHERSMGARRSEG